MLLEKNGALPHKGDFMRGLDLLLDHPMYRVSWSFFWWYFDAYQNVVGWSWLWISDQLACWLAEILVTCGSLPVLAVELFPTKEQRYLEEK